MNSEDLHYLSRYFFAHWHDRPEDDDAILAEILMDGSSTHVTESIRVLRNFLLSPDALETKAQFIRKHVWRYFCPDDMEAPVRWLEGILARLRQAFQSE